MVPILLNLLDRLVHVSTGRARQKWRERQEGGSGVQEEWVLAPGSRNHAYCSGGVLSQYDSFCLTGNPRGSE